MTRYQLRFAGSFDQEVFHRVAERLKKSDAAHQHILGIALLAPPDDGDFNTERVVVETQDISVEELKQVKRKLKKFPELRRGRVHVDVYEVLGQVVLGQ